MSRGKLQELVDEFRQVFIGRSGLLDAIVPPIIFVVLNAWLGLEFAAWISLAYSVLIASLRLLTRRPMGYALGGLGAVVLALLIVRVSGLAEGYFLPRIITTGLESLLCVVSVIAGRPLVAWTSHLARRWPLKWYWHARVRPAYSEVTLGWGLVFALRLVLELYLFRSEQATLLGIVQIISGWPFTIVLLAGSYIYGLWRLRHLKGPSVEEFIAGSSSPWEGQKRGF